MSPPSPTRQRLLEEGIRLFAERGFFATTVGEIESAVGLQPRRGALYKHFANKRALLDAALRAKLDSAARGAVDIASIDMSGFLQADRATREVFVRGLGRWFLDEMDRTAPLTRVLEHDGPDLPEIVAEMKTNLVDLSYRTATALITSVAPTSHEPNAIAVMLLGSLVSLRRTTWTFGGPPLDVDDERALTAWTTIALVVLDAITNLQAADD